MFIELSRDEKKAATKARILETARKQLERDGYEATSIRSVATEAGVAAGTVLLHFHDKQDLLHAALFDDLERTWAAARDASKAHKKRSLVRDLEALAGAFFDYYASHPALSRTLLRESLFASPPWSERFAAQIAEVHAYVGELTLAAKGRGEIREKVDAALLGAAFFSFYYFALMAWLQGGQPDPLRIFQLLLRQHLKGLSPTRRRKS